MGNNRFDKNQFNKGEEYLISGLELITQEVDLTQWKEFAQLKIISDRINEAKTKNENDIKCGEILAYLPKFYNFKDIILVSPKPPTKTYKYINLETKKLMASHLLTITIGFITTRSRGKRCKVKEGKK